MQMYITELYPINNGPVATPAKSIKNTREYEQSVIWSTCFRRTHPFSRDSHISKLYKNFFTFQLEKAQKFKSKKVDLDLSD
jgi:hypothetical protein